ncbi:MAG: trypsin-like peptidase domain-containing protein [Kineosporiaceae bacterium]|nr:trypsin-like peptidase domain-containing protein [Kineosporiaceae bacterium]
MNDLMPRLRAAGQGTDWDLVHVICRDYVQDLQTRELPPGRNEWSPVLAFLRQNRRADDLVMLADSLMAIGVRDGVVQRAVAQTMVDRGFPAVARVLFAALAENADPDSEDWSEARGGVARCTKDLFLAARATARREQLLQEAYDLYRAAYDENEANYWHGINAVALAARAARDGLALNAHPEDGMGEVLAAEEARRLAERISVRLNASDPDEWSSLTLVETDLALGRTGPAQERAEALVNDETVSAFALNALLRQLGQIWQLDVETEPGRDLLPLLRAGVLSRTGGDVLLDPDELARDRVGTSARAANPNLEKVFGADRYVSLPWYRRGLVRCRAVARIETPLSGGVGTGFLVRARDIGLDRDDVVVLTNAHVVPGGVDADDADVAFHALQEDDVRYRFSIREVLWTSPPDHLDATVLLLDEAPAGVEPVEVTDKPPAVGAKTPQRAYVIGHPRGIEVPQFSLQDNEILDHDETFVHYRSPTEPGSSGSPVFDNQWRAIALHHSGDERMHKLNGRSGHYQANEGIRLSAITAVLGTS